MADLLKDQLDALYLEWRLHEVSQRPELQRAGYGVGITGYTLGVNDFAHWILFRRPLRDGERDVEIEPDHDEPTEGLEVYPNESAE